MMKAMLRTGAIGTMAVLAACATPAPETRVTRFNIGQPIAPQRVSIEPVTPAAAQSLEYQTYAAAVGAELGRLGFTVVPTVGAAEMVASIDVQQGTRGEIAQRSPISIGLGGGGFSGGGYRHGGGVGLGGGVSFPIGRSKTREVIGTDLAVRLKRRSEGSAVWEGRASTQALSGTTYASPDATAAKLAGALFKNFPGRSGETITVK